MVTINTRLAKYIGAILLAFSGPVLAQSLPNSNPYSVRIMGSYFDGTEHLKSVYMSSKIQGFQPLSYSNFNSNLDVATQMTSHEDMGLVYDVYKKQIGLRETFTDDFIEKLQAEDLKLAPYRVMGFALQRIGGMKHEMYFGIYDGTERNLNDEFKLPLERKYPELKLANRNKNIPIFEIRRLAKDKTSPLDILAVTRLLAYHFKEIGLKEYVLYAHTDRVGAHLYKKFGFEVEFDSSQLNAADEYILSVNSKVFESRVRQVYDRKNGGAISCQKLFL
jgi:hypothetical protein